MVWLFYSLLVIFTFQRRGIRYSLMPMRALARKQGAIHSYSYENAFRSGYWGYIRTFHPFQALRTASNSNRRLHLGDNPERHLKKP